MPKTASNSKVVAINPDYVRMYYEHQNDRVSRHEDMTLTLSNIVLTISAVVITFGFNNKQAFGHLMILFLPTIIIFANIFAILFINDRARWISQHSRRAKRVLEVYANELFILDREIVAPPKKLPIYRKTIQNFVHYLFTFIGILLLAIFILDACGILIG